MPRFWIFKKARLVEIYHEEMAKTKKGENSNRGIRFVQTATSRGMLFPVKFAEQEAISMDKMIAEIQQLIRKKSKCRD